MKVIRFFDSPRESRVPQLQSRNSNSGSEADAEAEAEYVTVNANGEEEQKEEEAAPQQVISITQNPIPISEPEPMPSVATNSTALNPDEELSLREFIREAAMHRDSHPVREEIHVAAEVVEEEALITEFGCDGLLCYTQAFDNAAKQITPYLDKARTELANSSDYAKQALGAVADLAYQTLEHWDEQAKAWITEEQRAIAVTQFVAEVAQCVAESTKPDATDTDAVESIATLFEPSTSNSKLKP